LAGFLLKFFGEAGMSIRGRLTFSVQLDKIFRLWMATLA
jgi:hypothetical protein